MTHDRRPQLRAAMAARLGLQVGELSSLDLSVGLPSTLRRHRLQRCTRRGHFCVVASTWSREKGCVSVRVGARARVRVSECEVSSVWLAGWVTWPAAPLTSRLTITYQQSPIPERSIRTPPPAGGAMKARRRMSPLYSGAKLAYHDVSCFFDAYSHDHRPRRTTGLLAVRGWGISPAPDQLPGRCHPLVGGLQCGVMAESVPGMRFLAMEGVPPPSPHYLLFDSARSRPSSDGELIHPLPIVHVSPCPCQCQWYE